MQTVTSAMAVETSLALLHVVLAEVDGTMRICVNSQLLFTALILWFDYSERTAHVADSLTVNIKYTELF